MYVCMNIYVLTYTYRNVSIFMQADMHEYACMCVGRHA